MTTVRDATLQVLRAHGVDRVFGNPGSTELFFLRDWPKDIDYVLGLQEACVVGMADGYAQATGRPAFVNLHSAVGIGHGLGNLFTAYRNKTPLVILAGQQARSILRHRPFLFAEDAAQFPKPYVKWSIEPARAEDVPEAIQQAFLMAAQYPRGPAFVSVPSDDWARAAPEPRIRRVATEFVGDPSAIARLADALGKAARPVIVAGPDVDRSGAVGMLVKLAEAIQAPVWSSPMSSRASFPERHRLFAGFLQAAPAMLSDSLRGADLILVIGAPVFTFHVEGACELLSSGTPLWQLTDDPTDAASAAMGESVVGTIAKSLHALLDALPATRRQSPAPREAVTPPEAATPIPVEYALSRLAAQIEDAIVVEEAPSHRPAIQRYLPRPGADSFYTMASGGLGYGLPASVGIALARPGRRIVCLIGDGSALYSVQALWTAAQRRLPVTFIVLNNAGYGAMRSLSRHLNVAGAPGIDVPGVDFIALARGFGCLFAERIAQPEHLDRVLRAALSVDGPAMVDISVDQSIPALYRRGPDAGH